MIWDRIPRLNESYDYLRNECLNLTQARILTKLNKGVSAFKDTSVQIRYLTNLQSILYIVPDKSCRCTLAVAYTSCTLAAACIQVNQHQVQE